MSGRCWRNRRRLPKPRMGIWSWVMRDRDGRLEIVSSHNTDTMEIPSTHPLAGGQSWEHLAKRSAASRAFGRDRGRPRGGRVEGVEQPGAASPRFDSLVSVGVLDGLGGEQETRVAIHEREERCPPSSAS